jgi:hypothetical protein
MRRELGAAVKVVLDGVDTNAICLVHHEREALLAAADLVTLARTAVERDRQGNVTYAHAAEMPTRFVKQLTQIARGAVAIGMDRDDATRLAIRCARDSMPPLRLEILKDLTAHPDSTPSEVRKRLDKPHNTIDRELQALHILKLVTLSEKPYSNRSRDERTRWHYSLRRKQRHDSVSKNVCTPPPPRRGAWVYIYLWKGCRVVCCSMKTSGAMNQPPPPRHSPQTADMLRCDVAASVQPQTEYQSPGRHSADRLHPTTPGREENPKRVP